jgi:hypothetical protein
LLTFLLIELYGRVRAIWRETGQYIEVATGTEMNTMSHQPKSFWHRPLSKGAGRVLVLVAFGGAIFFEGWLGRKLLFVAHDRRYIVAFVLFVTCQVILLGALKAVAGRARRIGDDASFGTLQVWAGVLSCLPMALFGIFHDYTTSHLDFGSVLGSVITGLILGVWNAASMKPTLAEHV